VQGIPRQLAFGQSSDSELEILRQACLTLQSRKSDGVASIIRWIRAALGWKDSSVRLLMPNEAGRLREAGWEGKPSLGPRGRATEERHVFETQVSRRVPLSEPGSELAILPLVFEGRSIGILEVEGPRERIESRRPTLEALAALAASLQGNLLTERDELDRNEGRLEPVGPELELSLAWAAHEIRGPLLDAKAGIDRALTTVDAPARRGLLSKSSRELAELAASIHPLLSWGAGGGAADRRLTNLTREVQAAVENWILEDPSVLHFNATADVVVRVDRTEIRRAIANIVGNAMKYADPGTPIEISVDQDGDVATVRVANRGPAIHPASQQSIFRPFVKDPSSGHRGTGLGLFIAHRIVEAHCGTIRVGSSAGWTTFSIELPAELSSSRSGGVSPDSGPDRR
jgi:two-component system, OmpR family, sensor histidine kinase KdpD